MDDTVSNEDPRKVRLLEWLTTLPTERVPDSMNKLSQELGVSPKTLRTWRDDPFFARVWEVEARKIAGTPERTQQVLQALFETATDRQDKAHVSAAKTWLDQINRIAPVDSPQGASDAAAVKAFKDMTNEELAAFLAAPAKEVLEERRNG